MVFDNIFKQVLYQVFIRVYADASSLKMRGCHLKFSLWRMKLWMVRQCKKAGTKSARLFMSIIFIDFSIIDC